MSIYKDCDIRGVYGKELNDIEAEKIAAALGTMFTGEKVVLGGDVRLSTPALKKIMCDTLANSGCEVIDIGEVPTPVFYFALKQRKAKYGVMVTASHNPSEYNGFKLVLGEKPVTACDMENLKMLIAKGGDLNLPQIRDNVTNYECVIDEYIECMAKKFSHVNKQKIVIDAGNGAAALTSAKLFRRIGFDVVEIFAGPDGRFPNRPPNPALAENLRVLEETVKKTKAKMGIAFDGDGDRGGFVDENGCFVDNDYIMAILARNFCESANNVSIVYDAKCSVLLPEVVRKYGGKAVMAKAGHTYSKLAAIENDAIFAGEISGHFYFQEIGYDDPNFAALKLCEVLGEEFLSESVKKLPYYYSTPDIRVNYSGDDKEEIITEMARYFEDVSVSMIDGLRVDWEDGWGMIRSSVTEPMFTLRFEGKSKERLNEILQLFLAAMPTKVRESVEKEILK